MKDSTRVLITLLSFITLFACASAQDMPHEEMDFDCEVCHSMTEFKGVQFDHTANTGFTLDGNMWKRHLINYTVTPDTVLTFEYRSSNRPEISGIGFDNDINFVDRTFGFSTAVSLATMGGGTRSTSPACKCRGSSIPLKRASNRQ